MQIYDPSNFMRFLQALPRQITEAPDLLRDIDLTPLQTEYHSIVILGMGGSAIAGDLLSGYLRDELPIPILVNRNYSLPAYVGPHSLVIGCSYSGNTEETLHGVQEAQKRGASMVLISSGGKLMEFAHSENLPHIRIPEGYPPRQALGYMFFSILHLFEQLKLISNKESEIRETVEILENMNHRFHPEETHGQNLPNHIAQKLFNRIPLIYSACEDLYAVGFRWCTQLNENAKTLAFHNNLPELNHNEIMGWEAPRKILQNLCVVFLRNNRELSRNLTRVKITRDILRKIDVPIFEIFSEGESRLARMFSLIDIGDWVSYYLASMYGKDPLVIDNINYLKEQLSQIE